MNKVFGLVKQIDSRPEFSKNGSRPIFAARRHGNSMKLIFQRNRSTIRRTAFLLLFSIITVTLLVFTLFGMVSCGDKDHAKAYIKEYEKANETDWEEYDAVSYLVDSLMKNRRGDGTVADFSSGMFYLHHYTDFPGGAKLQRIDNDNLFAIKKLRIENESPAYMYALFTYSKSSDHWLNDFQYYMVSEILEKNDFAKLNVGDTAEDFYQVDNAVMYDLEATCGRYDARFVSRRLLRDGIMVIAFERPSESKGNAPELSEFTASEITFYEYATMDEPVEISSYWTISQKYKDIQLPE